MQNYEKATFLETLALLWGGAIGWAFILTIYYWLL